jgi:hypothetical protein
MATYTWSKKALHYHPLCVNSLTSEDSDRNICDTICMYPWDGDVFDGPNYGQCGLFCNDFYTNIRKWSVESPFTDTTAVFPFFEENGPINDGAAGAFNADHYSTYWRAGLNPADIRPTELFFPCYGINQFCFKSITGCLWVAGNVQYWAKKNEGLAVPIQTCTDTTEWHDYEYGTWEQHADIPVPYLSTIANTTFNCTNPDFGSEFCFRDNFDTGNNKWGAVSTGAFAYFDPPLKRFWPDTAEYDDIRGLEITDANIALYPLNAGPARPGVDTSCDSLSPAVPKRSQYQIDHQYRYWYMTLEPFVDGLGSTPNKWRATLTVASGGDTPTTYHRAYRTTFSGMGLYGSAYAGNEESTYPGDTSSVPTSAIWEGDIDCDNPYVISLALQSGDAGGHYPDPLILKAVK